jgi:hypothetical protein
MERVERIELSTKPWQGLGLPLHHTRKNLEHREGFEPPAFRICNPVHWTTLPSVHKLAPEERFELPTCGFGGRRSANWNYSGTVNGAGRVNRTPSSFEAAYKAAAIPLCETGYVWLRVTDSNCRCSWLMRPEW